MTKSTVLGSPLIELLPADAIKNLLREIEDLTPIVHRLSEITSLKDKICFLNDLQEVKLFFNKRLFFLTFTASCSPLEEYLIKSLVVIRQADVIFAPLDQELFKQKDKILKLLEDLTRVESFYDHIGGVIGYHLMCIKLLYDMQSPKKTHALERYHPPSGIDLTKEDLYLKEVVLEGIAKQGEMAELYPVGGAADRLKLQDEKTHYDLPAARLEFLGRTLLEGMIRDVQAREYLHFKVFNKQVITPIALMTSHEKNNDYLIQEIVREKGYFGRSKGSFKFFSQPLVPTFTQEGKWCLEESMKLLLKPGGHGVIWKLALEDGILEWFFSQGRTKALIRQINNPIAGVDLGLVALSGVGCKENKVFGFASCLRRVKTSEGMNLLKETTTAEGVSIVLSNIEYCDFKKCGIEDVPKNSDQPYSIFPSNTNILFADLTAISKVVNKLPYPGMLINFKEMKHYKLQEGEVVAPVARLELLMQNIADGFSEVFAETLEENSHPKLNTFITFNHRHKTISPTKKQFIPGSGLVETALGCFYDYLKNTKELLEDVCRFSLPAFPKEEDFLEQGPPFIVLYHPALGPLYSVIGQKIRRGSLSRGAELQLEIADVDIEGLDIEGSLLVEAFQIMGHYQDGRLCYSNRTGKCCFKNVVIKNKGIDHSQKNIYWKNLIQRKESCRILLEGCSEFVAEGIVLEGDFEIVVRDGERVVAKQEGNNIIFQREQLEKNSLQPYWSYYVDKDQSIKLK